MCLLAWCLGIGGIFPPLQGEVGVGMGFFSRRESPIPLLTPDQVEGRLSPLKEEDFLHYPERIGSMRSTVGWD
jgi:hypothetical protein